MKTLLTSAGFETENIKNYFLSLLDKDAALSRALFIPTAAVDVEAIAVLPKCANDLLGCGIKKENITVYDLHSEMGIDELRFYDLVYICGGNTRYLLKRMNEAGFSRVLMQYIQENKIVIGVSAGSIIFANNHPGNLGLINTCLEVHCAEGEDIGKVNYPLKEKMRLTDSVALAIREFPGEMEIIG